uniref:DNA polymerase zeta catalytic subunit N-terminal domain-containing protein n=1 Tax=Fagus sylvatica TaxID=28930 RepID=A0A2N9F662_FAGSY
MADTQADSNVFSVRIVSIDYYMAAPISGLDFCYSSFQGGKVNEVPVIRIYGSTPTGQKTCLHIHKPSKYTPCVLEGQQENFCEAYEVKAAHSDFSMYDSATAKGHREIDNVKEYGFGVTAMATERFQQKAYVASSCLQMGLVECGVFGADCSMYESGHKDEPSLVWVCDKSSENLAGTNVTTDLMASSLMGTQSSMLDDCGKAQSFLPDDCDKDLPESGSGSHVKPILDHLYQENPRILNAERSAFGDGISRPDGKSKPTPLSQSGFRDPASVGGGQQLTLLSIEVQAESRGDLRPNPRFDAINVIALAIQNDTDSIPEVFVFLHSKLKLLRGISPFIQKGTAVVTAVIKRTLKLEMQYLAAVCRHCGGDDWVVESGVNCSSLACSVFYERWKVQKEL